MTSNKEFIKDVFRLGLPMALQSLLSASMTLVGNVMIGSLGEVNISAVSVAGTFCWLVNVFVDASAKGATIIGAQEYGRGDISGIKKLTSFVITMSLIITSCFAIFISLFAPEIVNFYSDIPGITEPGALYLNITKYGLFFFAISSSIVSALQTVRDVKVGMIASMTSCGITAILTYVLINGLFGFPILGIKGVAIANVAGRVFELFILLVYITFFEKKINFKFSEFNPFISKAALKQFAIVSAPMMLTEMLENIASSAQTVITGHMTEYYLSANSITHICWNLPCVFSWGVGTSAAIIIGNSLGRGDFEQARLDGKRLVITSFVLGAFCFGMVQVLVPIVSSMYNVQQQTIELAYKMGKAASVIVFFNSIFRIVGEGVIRAAGDTKRILWYSIISKLVIATPFGYIGAFYLNLPAEWIYFILRSGTLFMALWSLLVIRKDEWMRTL